ncbi:type II secretion system GspH family protein [Aeoliella sp. ICT_H6.2]|uniref:Type II secretion system GspH family protein n=1 Tax=Aeoliella straminimaris TaxID=2954799 RepID=A0A9X2JKX4_9BACT|nr:type II secretion system protein [Aeoliella straminimaris]MCO6047594.1 type II secretion system GspH family protein [Aeoliella straminimaris]
MTGHNQVRSANRHAFTLLEVILAIAILAISLGYIGTIISQAFTNSANAVDGLEARIVGQTIIDQLKCGSMQIENAGPMQLSDTEALEDWLVQIMIEPTTVEQLVQVRVLVGRKLDGTEHPACELVRWFQDPEYAEQMAVAAASAATAATAESSGSTSTSQ